MFHLLIPMAIGAVGGALANKKDPLTGALMGGGIGAATGGLGGLGGAAGGEAASAISGAALPATADATVQGAISGAAPGAGLGLSLTPAQALGASPSNLAGMGGGQGLLSGQGAAASGMGGAQGVLGGMSPKPSTDAGTGLLSPSGLKTITDMAGIAGKMGLMDSPQGPVAQSAGIPARQADFTGLLSAGRSNQLSGAEKLMAQRNARRG